MLGPVGFSGLFAPKGEVQAARAAFPAGIPFCASIFGISTIEELCAESDGNLWLQLYLIRDRELVESFIERAEKGGVEAICITVDSAVGGIRERDNRNGFRNLSKITPGIWAQLMRKPGWCLSVGRRGMPAIGNLSHKPEYGRHAFEQAVYLASQMNPGVTWADLAWVRERWKGKLIIKGILNCEDARAALGAGADAVIISNHGGRQLDSAPSTISVLPEIAAAVGGHVEVLIDGGIRRGSQIVKALALGADGVLLGRAYAYGLAAAGERGVAAVIQMLATEVDVTIGHMGVASIAALKAGGRELLRPHNSLPHG
jgi:isopentenyl diphosphate isomerase/L-lactate dehydrogenase-like FMN-dependent dehydrogenase